MTGGVAQVHEPALGQHDDRVPIREDPLVDLGLDGDLANADDAGEAVHVDLVVEVTDVAQDRLVLHPRHVFGGDDALVARGGDDDIRLVDDVVEPGDLIALQQCLQCADRVDLRDDDARTLAGERLGRALTDVAVAADDRDLAADQHIGSPVEAVDQRVPDAVLVVELALRHRVVDIDCREQQLPPRGELVEPVDPGRGLLGDATDAGCDACPHPRRGGQRAAQCLEDYAVLVGHCQIIVADRGDRARLLELDSLVDQQGRVPAVVENHVGADRFAVVGGEGEQLLGAPPVLFEGFALPCEDRHTRRLLGRPVRSDDGCGGGMVLGGEDVAGDPAYLRAEGDQGLDQHGGLHGHVQRTGDAGAVQWASLGIFTAQRHQAGHLVLGEPDLLAPELGESEVGDGKGNAVAAAIDFRCRHGGHAGSLSGHGGRAVGGALAVGGGRAVGGGQAGGVAQRGRPVGALPR